MRMHPRLVRFYLILLVLTALATVCVFLESLAGKFPDGEHIVWLLGKFPYFALFALGYLALRLNRSRTMFVAITWLVAYTIIRYWPSAGAFGIDTRAVLYTAAISVPLSTMLVQLLPESRHFGLTNVLRLAIVFAPPALLLAFVHAQLELTTYLFFPESGIGVLHVPVLAILLAVAAAVALSVTVQRTTRYASHTSVACLLPLLVALNRQVSATAGDVTASGAAAAGFSLCAALLLYSLYRTYWETAYIDELTEVMNRRALNERVYNLGRHYAMIMADVDYFKSFNDTYGHAQGDTVLRFVSAYLDRAFPGHVYRYGGEEFCIVLDGTPMKTAARRIEAVRHLVSSKDFHIRLPEQARERTSQDDRGGRMGSKVKVHINFSAGVAYRDLSTETPESVIEMADKALYSAKHNGRGRICCYE